MVSHNLTCVQSLPHPNPFHTPGPPPSLPTWLASPCARARTRKPSRVKLPRVASKSSGTLSGCTRARIASGEPLANTRVGVVGVAGEEEAEGTAAGTGVVVGAVVEEEDSGGALSAASETAVAEETVGAEEAEAAEAVGAGDVAAGAAVRPPSSTGPWTTTMLRCSAAENSNLRSVRGGRGEGQEERTLTLQLIDPPTSTSSAYPFA